ncbi:hypothetical protein BJV82DRAFT_598065 [Fennellomyces sp. T-0311]|nr:hypothetical protein BJV82DRAFT_598065 [Fennellomyces sp. T-0311]
MSKETKLIDEEQQPLVPKYGDHKTEIYGLGILLLSSITSACMSLFIKLGGSYSIPSSEIVTIQTLVELVFITSSCSWKNVNPIGPSGVRRWLMLFGVVGGLMLTTEAYCTTNMPIADFTAMLQLNPVFTTILATLFLSEPFHYFHGACIALCMTGTIFVFRPQFLFGQVQQLPLMPSLGSLAVALLSAMLPVIIRRVGNRAYFLVFNLYFTLGSLLISLPSAGSFVWPQGWKQYVSLIMAGACLFFNGALINRGLQMAPAGPGSVIRMTRIVFATILGIFIFHEYPDALSLAGIAMITTGAGALILIIARQQK